MRIIANTSQSEVLAHWQKVERLADMAPRSDILNPLPNDLMWYLAEIEYNDLDRLHVISSRDWSDISNGTFQVMHVVLNLNALPKNKDSQRIGNNIRKKLRFLKSGGQLDTRLIAVANGTAADCPITLIEGNRRAVALAVRQQLSGQHIFLGISPQIIDYLWAKRSFPSNHQPTARSLHK